MKRLQQIIKHLAHQPDEDDDNNNDGHDEDDDDDDDVDVDGDGDGDGDNLLSKCFASCWKIRHPPYIVYIYNTAIKLYCRRWEKLYKMFGEKREGSVPTLIFRSSETDKKQLKNKYLSCYKIFKYFLMH